MRKFDYAEFLKVIQRYKITHLQVAPPIIVMLARRPETKNYDLSSLKYVMCGAAPLSKELQNEVQDRFKFAITQGWGMTETTCAGMHGEFCLPRVELCERGFVANENAAK